MKLTVPAVLLIFVGVILIYSAHQDKDPRNVVFEALGIKRRVAEPDWFQFGKSVGDAVSEGAKTLPGVGVPDSGVPPTAGTGPIVSV